MPNTYYVSPTGNDSNDGLSDGTAFLTLQKPVDVITALAAGVPTSVAGTTVIVRAGTYSAGFVIGWDYPISGTSGSPMSFLADSGVIITGRNGKTPDGIDVEGPGCDYLIFDGFTINNAQSNIAHAGIRVGGGSTGVIIRNNNCSHCGNWGIFSSFTTNVLIENNSCSYSVSQHGIYTSNGAISPTVRNNTCFNNAAQGLHFNGDASQSQYGLVTGATITGNILHNNGANGINGDGLQSSLIENNLIYLNGNNGITLYQIDASGPGINNQIVNNTIYQPSSGGAAVHLLGGSTGCTVFNNILIGGSYGTYSNDSASMVGLVSDHNIVVDKFSIDGGNSFINFSTWQSGQLQDADSAISNGSACFNNVSGNDYTEAGSSPTVDAGVSVLNSVNAPSTDINGLARPSGNGYDIGCYELNANAPTIVSRFPAGGSTGSATLPGSTANLIKATFNKSVVSGSITFTLEDSNSNPVLGDVVYDVYTLTAEFWPRSALSNGAYTATISGVQDPAGDSMPTAVWSFTVGSTGAAGTGVYNVNYGPGSYPGDYPSHTNGPTVCGQFFKSDSAGTITAIQFWCGQGGDPTNSSQNITGTVWDMSGNNLGQITGIKQVAGTGAWVTAAFSPPITISANTYYMISVYNPLGTVAVDSGTVNQNGTNPNSGGFYYTSFDSGPLHFPTAAALNSDSAFPFPNVGRGGNFGEPRGIGQNMAMYIGSNNPGFTASMCPFVYVNANIGTYDLGPSYENYNSLIGVLFAVPVNAGTLTGGSTTASSASVSWTAGSGGAGGITAQLYRSISGEDRFDTTAGGTSSPTTDLNLTPNTSYDYYVVYTDSIGVTAVSNTVTLTTASSSGDTTTPTTPANLIVTNSIHTCTLNWDASTDTGFAIGGYQVFRDGGYLNTTTQTNYVDSGLVAGQSHAYKVLAFDVNNQQSAFSSTVTGTPLSNVPPSGPKPAVTLVTINVTLSVTPVTNAISYRWLRNGTVIATTSLPTYLDSNVSVTGGLPVYTAVAIATDGGSPTSLPTTMSIAGSGIRRHSW